MSKSLTYREYGLNTKRCFENLYLSSRVKSLKWNPDRNFEASHSASVNSCNLDRTNQRFLLSGSGNGNIFIHDLHHTSRIFKLVSKIDSCNTNAHSFAVGTVQWYPHDTGLFTSSGMDGLVKIWDTNALKVASEFKFPGHVYCHQMAEYKLLIAVANESDKIQLLDLKSGSATHKLTGHYKKAVVDLCWSPRNDHHLYSAGKDGRVILWDIRKSKSCCIVFDQHNVENSPTSNYDNSNRLAHDGAVNSILLLPDGLHLLSFGTDKQVRLWDSQSGKNLLCNYGWRDNTSQIRLTMACSEYYAFVPCSGNVIVMDVFKGHPIKKLTAHFSQVNCCVFNSNQQELITGSRDRNILFWEAREEDDDEDDGGDDDGGGGSAGGGFGRKKLTAIKRKRNMHGIYSNNNNINNNNNNNNSNINNDNNNYNNDNNNDDSSNNNNHNDNIGGDVSDDDDGGDYSHLRTDNWSDDDDG